MNIEKKDLPLLKQMLEEASAVVFHKNSHLDDAATQWFLQDIVKIKASFDFQRNDQIQIDISKKEIGLDVIHKHAIKGYKQDDGGFSSAFRCVVEAFFEENTPQRSAMEPIILWVDGDDSKGSATKAILGKEVPEIEAVGLSSLFQAYKTLYRGQEDPVMNSEFGHHILSVLYKHRLELETAYQSIMHNCHFQLSGIIGVCEGEVPSCAIGFPQKYLCRLAQETHQPTPQIFLYKDQKIGVGMVRIHDKIRLDRIELKEAISSLGGQGWFFHPGGFLAAFGSATTPKNPDELGFSVQDLIKKVNEIYATL